MLSVRKDFPLLSDTYRDLIYFDNAASTQKPITVIKAINDYYTYMNANVHRGMYPLSELATDSYEQARDSVARFINADSKEVIFTGGTTDSINGASKMLTSLFKGKDKIKVLVSKLEHHSNLVPWQQLPNVELTYAELDQDYNPILPDISPDIVAITMCSNVTGTIVNIKEVREKYRDAILVVDAAQAVAHLPIDVKELGVDILSFSAHKMYGPMGIGVLYIKSSLAERLPPFRYGGGMIESVDLENSTWAKIPEKFEAGTPNVEGAWGLKAAIEYVLSIGFEKIIEHEKVLSEYMYEKLLQIPGILIYHPTSPREHCGVFSFTIEGIHAHDNSYLLGQRNIATRAGHHCAQVLHKEVLKVPATTRCSIGIYNTKEEVDKLINVLGEIISNFK